jgi:hypothetical protein
MEAVEQVLDLRLDLASLMARAAWSTSIIMARWKCATAPVEMIL